MAATSFAPHSTTGRRIPLAEIDAAVAARLGATRGLGNSQPACFNRQVAMYLAKHIGNWSTKTIGRYYGGRDHSTVCYGIQRIEALRDSDVSVDALVCELRRHLAQEHDGHHDNEDSGGGCCPALSVEELADRIAEQVYARLEKRLRQFMKGGEKQDAV
jgi:hypothetical protein